MDPSYGYQAPNVEAQERNGGSLLHWTKRMIEIRKRHPVFGRGGYEELNSSNPSVLAFVREYQPSGNAPDPEADEFDAVLCVNNLSRFPQPVDWTCAGSRASRRSSAWAGWSSPRSVSSPTR